MTANRAAMTPQLRERLYQLMVSGVRDYAIFMLDPGGFITTWNAGAQRINGYTEAEILGKHFSTFYELTEVRAGKPDYELKAAAEVGRFEDEGWRLRKDGTRFWANVVITVVRDETGALVGYTKVTRDLTERKQGEDEREILIRAERESRERAEASQRRLEALQSVTEAGLAPLDVSSLLATLLGRIAEPLVADVVIHYLGEPDDLRLASIYSEGELVPASAGESIEFARQVAEAGRPVTFDRIVHQDGEFPFFDSLGIASLLATAVGAGSNSPGVIAVANRRDRRFTDDDCELLTLLGDRVAIALDRARAIEAEQQAVAESMTARESARLRDEFLSVAAHELKTPVAALRVAAQLLERRRDAPGHDAEREATLLDQVVRQTRRIDRLVTHLLDVSRLQGGRLQVELVEADLATILGDVVGVMRATSGREIVVDAPDEARALIDGPRVEQVLFNLLDNAVKYSPADTVVEVALRESGGDVTIAVRDHGHGIPAESRSHIFERFHRAVEDTNVAGLGLGLYVSREIARAHGGEIVAEFPADGGSCFVVTLPTAR